MQYISAFLQRPTSAPASSNATPGTAEVAHLRFSTSGANTAAVVLSDVSLPTTIVWQGYVGEGFDRDAILVRQNSGAPWRRVPLTPANRTTLAVDLPADLPDTWETALPSELADNQATAVIGGLGFGDFNAATEPTQSFWVLNDGTVPIESLALGLPNNASGVTLSGRLRLDVVGTLATTGIGTLDTSPATGVLYTRNAPNSFPCPLPVGAAAKLTVTLVNFPAAGLAATALDSQLLLVPNASSEVAPPTADWAPGAVEVSLLSQHPYVTQDGPELQLQPYAVRVGSAVYRSTLLQPLPMPTTDGLYAAYVGVTGLPGVNLATNVPDNAVVLGEFTVTSGIVGNYRAIAPPRVSQQFVTPNAGLLEPGRAVGLVDGGLAHVSPAIGVALDSLGDFATIGQVRVQLSQGNSVALGGRLAPNSEGYWVPSSTGAFTALESGTSANLVLGYLGTLENQGGAGSGGGGGGGGILSLSVGGTGITLSNEVSEVDLPLASLSTAGLMAPGDKAVLNTVAPTNLGRTLAASAVTVTSSTGSSTSIPGATLENAGVLTAADKAALDALVAGGGGGGGEGAPTNLSNSRDGVSVTVISSTGANTTLLAADTTNAGVLTAANATKLANYPTNPGLTYAAFADKGEVAIQGLEGTAPRALVPLATTENAGLLSPDEKAAIAASGSAGTNLSANPNSTTVALGSSTGTGATLAAATTTNAGVLTAADKAKLDGVAPGASRSNLGWETGPAFATITNSGGLSAQVTLATTTNAGLMSPGDKATLAAGFNLGATPSPTGIVVDNSGGSNATLPLGTAINAGLLSPAQFSKLASISPAATVSNLGYTASPTQGTVTNSGGVAATLPLATTTNAGLFAPDDKTALDTLVAGGGGGGGGVTNLSIDMGFGGAVVSNSNGTGFSILQANNDRSGLLSTALYSKLLGVQTGATKTDLSTATTATHVDVLATGGTSARLLPATGVLAGLLSPGDKVKLDGLAATNLATTTTATTVTVTNSGGTNATLAAATTANAGVLTAADKAKLDGVATGATANATDASLRARNTHTGSQDLESTTSGTLPIGRGGTGATSAVSARTALGITYSPSTGTSIQNIGTLRLAWGMADLITSNNVDYALNFGFGTTFASTPNVQASFINVGVDCRLITLGQLLVTTTGVTAEARNNTAFATSGNPRVMWLAIGQGA